jgi:glucosamine-6-phosphate deaminase
MEIIISDTKQELGFKAAQAGALLIREAIKARGEANIIVATGASQFEMLQELVKEDINWSVVTAFHLDEYIGINEQHPASFRKYLKERFADLVMPKTFNYVYGDSDPYQECQRLDKLIQSFPIDVAFVGIGENGHLAFNDPPADFETEEAYLVVELNEACRKQQLGEGWFKTLEEVPKQAISMSIKQILKSKFIVCSVPDQRKAQAVFDTVTCEISPEHPASILRNHPNTMVYLDKEAASLLKNY